MLEEYKTRKNSLLYKKGVTVPTFMINNVSYKIRSVR